MICSSLPIELVARVPHWRRCSPRWLVQELPPAREKSAQGTAGQNPGRPQWPGIGITQAHANSKVCRAFGVADACPANLRANPMTAYADLIERRFGDGGPSGDGVADNEFIRRVIARKT